MTMNPEEIMHMRNDSLHNLHEDAVRHIINVSQLKAGNRFEQLANEGNLAARMHGALTGLDEDDGDAFIYDAISSMLHAAEAKGFSVSYILNRSEKQFREENASRKLIELSNSLPETLSDGEGAKLKTEILHSILEQLPSYSNEKAEEIIESALEAIPDMEKVRPLLVDAAHQLCDPGNVPSEDAAASPAP